MTTKNPRLPTMKINHAIIRNALQSIGISIFIVSVFFKLKAILLYGGATPPKIDPESEGLDEDKPVRDTQYDDPEDGEAKCEAVEAPSPDKSYSGAVSGSANTTSNY